MLYSVNLKSIKTSSVPYNTSCFHKFSLDVTRVAVATEQTLKPLETKLLDAVLTEEFLIFVVFVIVLRQCSHLCVRKKLFQSFLTS